MLHLAKITERRKHVESWQGRLHQLKSILEHARTERQKADACRAIATTEALLQADAQELQSLRETYRKVHHAHVQEQEELTTKTRERERQLHEEGLQALRERDALRK